MPVANPPAITDTQVIEWTLTGNVSAGTAQDGLRPMHAPGIILEIIVTAGQKGNTGAALFDVHKHVPAKPVTTQRDNTAGVTVYTTQGNRPDILGDNGTSTQNSIKEAAAPDVTAFLAGDFFTVDVDAANATMQDVTVSMRVQYN
ncbi:hypothetical protein LCGC14_1391530 [marine sediment metagenome]|uniref:Fimbrial-type adhesion domain-containing protein n=1 Tax=marine sediment metagenome TaxID=412755 RepID=A0A0F9K030_9ZZZZ